MIKVIANADDFGKSHEVNLGILDGFKRGALQHSPLESIQYPQVLGFTVKGR